MSEDLNYTPTPQSERVGLEREIRRILKGSEFQYFSTQQICNLIESREKALREEVRKAIREVEEHHPYKIVGKPETYSEYNEGWTGACDIVEQRIDTVFTQSKTTNHGPESTK